MHDVYPCTERSLWTHSDFKKLELASQFGDLVPIALDILERFEEPVVIVSGPISTGGFGTRDKNLAAFTAAIKHLQLQGRSVFDQTPFEVPLFRMAMEWVSLNRTGYCMPILNDFYGPVFRSGRIHTVAFMRGWESSFGAQWERRVAGDIPLAIEDLPLIEP